MPNLKELKVSVGKIPGLNLGSHLSGNPGLHHLHLVLSAPGGQETNLHRELQSPLPVCLNRVTVEASKMPVLHPAALKVSNSANQRPVSRSCDHSGPIRGQYPVHVITLDHSEASIQVM